MGAPSLVSLFRRAAIAVAIFGLALPQTAIVTAAGATSTTIRTGAPCAVPKAIQVRAGKRYICTRTSGRLVWLPLATAVKPSVPTPATPTQTKPVEALARTQLAQLSGIVFAKSASTVDVQRLMSPSLAAFDPARMEHLQAQLLGFWESQGVAKSLSLRVFYFTEQDRAWVDAQPIPRGCVFETYFNISKASSVDARTCVVKTGPQTIVVLIGSQTVGADSGWNSTLLVHETQHVIQGAYFGGELLDPCWFREGFTTYFEWLATRSANADAILRRSSAQQNLVASLQRSAADQVGKPYASWKITDWVDALSLHPAHPVCWGRSADGQALSNPISFGYLAGPIIVERLYIDFDLSRLRTFYESVGRTQDFKAAFESALGVSYQRWLSDRAVPWLLDSLREQRLEAVPQS